ncbi:MAG: acyl-CoA dehydrogenase family protein [Alphaproteobacteria bacterium]|jgi:cyclohexanecarboxyl-CoA dehydrogenase|nr:acyl-CoA dehydrogenase family protein [Alphaproteobacteria bacterium]
MDFSLSDDQIAIQDTARRFAAERLAPDYQKRETEGAFDRALLREMGKLGLIGVNLPSEFGGLEQDAVTAGLVIECIAHGDFNVSYVQLIGTLMGTIIAHHARPELAAEVVTGVASGEILVALGLTEPGGGSDAANLRVKARRDGDDYVLDGEKTSCSMADQSQEIMVLARTGTADEKAHGITAFLASLDSPGISTGRFEDMGTRVVGRGSVFFDGVRVPAERRLGQEGDGFRQIMHGFDYSRALIGLQCIAAATASLEETWEYVTQRQAFGQPIARYQGVTQPLAEAETLLEAARLLCYKTLWLRDHDLPHTSEAAMCKWWAPQVAFDVIHRCLITHGHYGYAKDLPHQQRLRDVLGLQIGDGTEQIQKMVISREKIGRVAVPY